MPKPCAFFTDTESLRLTCPVLLVLAAVPVPAIAQEHAETDDSESVQEFMSSPEAIERAEFSRTYRRAPDDSRALIEELRKEKDPLIERSLLSPVQDGWDRLNDGIEDAIGLRFGMTYTALYQQATASIGPDNAGGGVFELFGLWQLVGTPGETDGGIVFTLEHAHKYTDIPPDELGESVGSINKTVNEFGNEGFGFTDLYWLQHLADGRLSLRFGRIDQSDVFNAGAFTSDKLYFLAEPFSGNPTLPFPEHGLGFAADFSPDGAVYVGLGGAAAVGDKNGSTVGQLDDGEYFFIFEGGYSPEVEGQGRGHYSINVWAVNERVAEGLPSGRGLSLNFDQQFREAFGVFARYGLADEGGILTEQYAAAGAVATRPFDRHHDRAGVALSWSRPAERALPDQWNAEIFYRLQLTSTMQLTPSVQLIVDPAENPAEDAIAVFSLRARLEF